MCWTSLNTKMTQQILPTWPSSTRFPLSGPLFPHITAHDLSNSLKNSHGHVSNVLTLLQHFSTTSGESVARVAGGNDLARIFSSSTCSLALARLDAQRLSPIHVSIFCPRYLLTDRIAQLVRR